MEHIFENLVRCPQCRSAFCTMDESGEKSLACPKCRASYAVTSGVADLIPDLRFRRSLAQALMESPSMASIYDGKRWRRSTWQGRVLGIQFDQEAEVVMQAAQVEESSTVLDLACASGIYTRLFSKAARQGRVVGLDLSMPMLQCGARKNQDEHIENVVYMRGTAMELPFADAFFDVVNCCGALHLFPDPIKALENISRVIKPTGRFTLGTFQKGKGLLHRLRIKSGKPMGVNSFTSASLKEVLGSLGFAKLSIHHEAASWMILSGEKS